MSLEKVVIKNDRPGVMVTPGLRPPDESGASAPTSAADTNASAEDE